jgi:Helitron helicase-like domain at N-terminus
MNVKSQQKSVGAPSLFITLTCNPNWPEIRRNIEPWQTASDRPDIVARVFELKLKKLINYLTIENILGRTIGYVHVTEFQKRGLPHVHILLIFADEDKPSTCQKIDQLVQATIPDPDAEPELHCLVTTHMMHGPYGIFKPSSPCMNDGSCSKHFPKEFRNDTEINDNGYPLYARPNNGRSITKGGARLDNRYVAPYNKRLLTLFETHINVEICCSLKSIKYLFKYVYKGHDRSEVTVQQTMPGVNVIAPDEIKEYLDARYIGPPEACARIFGFKLSGTSHTVVPLAVHMPGAHLVTFSTNSSATAPPSLEDRQSTLMAWFKLNRECPEANRYFYEDIPRFYRWHAASKKWIKRTYNKTNVIGRLLPAFGSETERYHLRLLLLDVPGAKSYEDLRTYRNTLGGFTFSEFSKVNFETSEF